MRPKERSLTVVDAANVIGSRPDGWWRDRARAARRLLAEVREGPGYDEVAVVLEGGARQGASPGRDGRVRVVHAEASGDDAIVDLVTTEVEGSSARTVTVVTADRALRARVVALGASVQGPQWLWHRLDSQP